MTGKKTNGKAKRERGAGSIIERPGTDKLYIRFYGRDGKQIQRATGTNDRAEAQRQLIDAMADEGRGETVSGGLKYEDLRRHYLRLKPEQEQYPGLQHLDSFFKDKPVADIDTDSVLDFIEFRRDEDEVSDPTIRRNLVCLRAIFNAARKAKMIGPAQMPHFPMPADSDPAGEYISPSEFDAILGHLPDNLKPLFQFLYGTSCRLGAACAIRWSMVNEDATVISLPAAIVKQKKPLTLVLAGELAPMAAMLRRQFRNPNAPVFDSTNYRPEFARAVAKAGLGTWNEERRTRTGVRIHDLRGSAATNLVDAGVDEGLVMRIGGWKVRAMLDRYVAGSTERIKAAMEKAAEHIKTLRNAEAV